MQLLVVNEELHLLLAILKILARGAYRLYLLMSNQIFLFLLSKRKSKSFQMKIKNALLLLICLLAMSFLYWLCFGFLQDELYLIGSILKRTLFLCFLIKWFKNNLDKEQYLKNNKLIMALLIVLLLFAFAWKATKIELNLANLVLNVGLLSSSLFTGILEEFMFRLYIFYAMIYGLDRTSKGYYFKTIVYTSLLFSFAHMIHLLGPTPIFGVVNQMFLAFFLGILLQLFFIRFGNILLPSVIHALINYHTAFSKITANRSSFGEEEITLVTAVFLCCTIGAIFWYITGSVLLPKKAVVKRTM